jgi:hypothetical protein
LVFAALAKTVIPPRRTLPKISVLGSQCIPMKAMTRLFNQLQPFGLPDISGPAKPVRGRIMLYAFKLLGRLSGHLPTH